jgi:nitrate/nitrite transporter NarK
MHLHNVHHISTVFSILLLAPTALAGLLTCPLRGTLTDRIGPVKVILLALVTDAASLA